MRCIDFCSACNQNVQTIVAFKVENRHYPDCRRKNLIYKIYLVTNTLQKNIVLCSLNSYGLVIDVNQIKLMLLLSKGIKRESLWINIFYRGKRPNS